jgi:hypothetical protein
VNNNDDFIKISERRQPQLDDAVQQCSQHNPNALQIKNKSKQAKYFLIYLFSFQMITATNHLLKI